MTKYLAVGCVTFLCFFTVLFFYFFSLLSGLGGASNALGPALMIGIVFGGLIAIFVACMAGQESDGKGESKPYSPKKIPDDISKGDSIYCNYCGAKVKKKSSYCQYCGKKLGAITT